MAKQKWQEEREAFVKQVVEKLRSGENFMWDQGIRTIGGADRNAVTGKPYRGGNAIRLWFAGLVMKDEFQGELKNQFGLPPFPLLYASNLLCKMKNGWSFNDASALERVQHCQHPMLFIHGSSDTFVPTSMVYRLYEAKPSRKKLWIAEGAENAKSYLTHKDEYFHEVQSFLHEAGQ